MSVILEDATITHSEKGHHWRLPAVVNFSLYASFRFMCFYNIVEYRCPKRGEYYLSGKPVQAWFAPNDLGNEFLVVVPTTHAKKIAAYEVGDAVNFWSDGRMKDPYFEKKRREYNAKHGL